MWKIAMGPVFIQPGEFNYQGPAQKDFVCLAKCGVPHRRGDEPLPPKTQRNQVSFLSRDPGLSIFPLQRHLASQNLFPGKGFFY